MGEWLVELEGHPAELDRLADQFLSPGLNVRKEGERNYLRSREEFDGLSDADDVRARATELLLLLSGIANLYAGAGETVTPGTVIWERDDGTRDQFLEMKPARMRVRATLRLGTKATDPTVGESWLTLAQQDPNVLDALHFFQEGISWWSIRKAYEVIQSEFGGQESRVASELSVPVDEIRRFKKWTHHYVHGGRGEPPDIDRYPPLSQVKAESFLRDLLKNWIHWKQNRQEASR
jgi:hypothetical protein